MSEEQRDPAAGNDCVDMEGRGEMIKAPIDLQDLRRRLYVKAKAEPSWRFWGIYVHVCKMETLRRAYALAKANNGAPGIDGVTFEAIISRPYLNMFLVRWRTHCAACGAELRTMSTAKGWRQLQAKRCKTCIEAGDATDALKHR